MTEMIATIQTVLLLVIAFLVGIVVGIITEGVRRNLLEDTNIHVHNWNRWDKKEAQAFKRSLLYGAVVGTNDYTAVWQERACTTCGYIEREKLELP